jgi:hypothetical protein
VLLTKSHGSFFPVGHLFTLADFKAKNFFSYLGEAGLLSSDENFAVVGLSVDEVAHVLVKVHTRQVLREHVHVTFEGEADADGALVCEEFGEHLIKHLAVGEADHID